ncbi:MAG: hypothetical protein UT41_C0001G0379 [Candidatus Wolfebacteria bacterium GW2011_GWC2_39_22]|uniref:Uncharacterized protein n=1 Tax=Candidatus Wolfebacteria bacterium GW2011_GWC2_39_22 TaxID=1619013 RepID=A0A0G0QR29_9BACT|nr:MAG: hypothetical protein UT41_C0001G0379 [Candidatus Wolfebacteria bacterium GW2011_GWC2_39_22]HBI25503.1 hypothetical protein [Candidatus Wolfebacteria bacterium]
MQNIPLTKEKFLTVLKAIDACEMMQSAIEEADGIEEKAHDTSYRELKAYLLKQSDLFGLDKINPKKEEEADWSEEISEDASELINAYAEVEMFDNLAWDLASMEFEKQKGSETVTDMEEFVKRGEIYDAIMDEFDANDLENVRIAGLVE